MWEEIVKHICNQTERRQRISRLPAVGPWRLYWGEAWRRLRGERRNWPAQTGHYQGDSLQHGHNKKGQLYCLSDLHAAHLQFEEAGADNRFRMLTNLFWSWRQTVWSTRKRQRTESSLTPSWIRTFSYFFISMVDHCALTTDTRNLHKLRVRSGSYYTHLVKPTINQK